VPTDWRKFQKCRPKLLIVFVGFWCVAAAPPPGGLQITVINMMPKSLSGEYHQDSEPNIAVNPANPKLIAASAFTPDPTYGPRCPIYISSDGGNTWALNSIVPSEAGSKTGTSDITLRFGSGNSLYAGILRFPNPAAEPRLNILRTADYSTPTLMKVLVDRTGAGVDQPYVQAVGLKDESGAAKDLVVIGDNDFNDQDGHTATVDYSLDGANSASPFKLARLERRSTISQDGPEIRPAISSDGRKIYAAFYGWRKWDANTQIATFDLVVVRDDAGATGTNPFGALTEPADQNVGVRVVSSRQIPFKEDFFGVERVGGDPAIAVSPINSSLVYVAWSDLTNGAFTLHLRRSADGGTTWSDDLRSVSNAKNPGLAVNTEGVVGFVYQQFENTAGKERWLTRFEESGDDFKTKISAELANTPGNDPRPLFVPYLGDYIHLMSVGSDFYGIFSANNTPDKANFPSGVKFQRNADFNTKKLLSNDSKKTVPISIDPFFFKVAQHAP
jgi:hypothetical protein